MQNSKDFKTHFPFAFPAVGGKKYTGIQTNCKVIRISSCSEYICSSQQMRSAKITEYTKKILLKNCFFFKNFSFKFSFV